MNEATLDTTNETNGMRTPSAHELAIAYEATSEPTNSTPAEAVTPDVAVVSEDVPVVPVVDVAASEPLTSGSADAPPTPAIAAPLAGLRLRLKVWSDRATGKRYLMPTAYMRDVVRGQPISDVMHAYAMSEEDTKLVTLTAREWNALPFFHFQEDGPAPRASVRPVDVVDTRGKPT